MDVCQALQDFECKLTTQLKAGFRVYITIEGLLLQPEPVTVAPAVTLPLQTGLHQTLATFFSGVDFIPHNSFDYITLKSLLNAHSTLERMRSKNLS